MNAKWRTILRASPVCLPRTSSAAAVPGNEQQSGEPQSGVGHLAQMESPYCLSYGRNCRHVAVEAKEEVIAWKLILCLLGGPRSASTSPATARLSSDAWHHACGSSAVCFKHGLLRGALL
mmetsp:Transcript_11933/g.21850  ORF Transcript_11933/g.21850 Transcript_11933/m.21850 type:complete len:120 (-) Transcript_11933:225-584(-)